MTVSPEKGNWQIRACACSGKEKILIKAEAEYNKAEAEYNTAEEKQEVVPQIKIDTTEKHQAQPNAAITTPKVQVQQTKIGFDTVKSVFTGAKGRGAQATAIVATVAAAAALTYVVGRSQGVFLTNEEKIEEAQKKLLEAKIALEAATKTKEKSSDAAEIKTLSIKIIALNAKIASIEKDIEKLKTKN